MILACRRYSGFVEIYSIPEHMDARKVVAEWEQSREYALVQAFSLPADIGRRSHNIRRWLVTIAGWESATMRNPSI